MSLKFIRQCWKDIQLIIRADFNGIVSWFKSFIVMYGMLHDMSPTGVGVDVEENFLFGKMNCRSLL
ncbi:hypothetical protein TSUD_126410 [Trifolium subterraneum]|uniref:Uncharacterized protein n=1 Tax=Trifolium subterraneum TaxID=3900 RepID=A0A2Z6MVG0_TRISU|nr:hypothetical protein TSUD_126410 [Trifolium subterraneum]